MPQCRVRRAILTVLTFLLTCVAGAVAGRAEAPIAIKQADEAANPFKGPHKAQGALIYLHGSPHEKLLGQPASGGCIRMSSGDVIALFNMINVGTSLTILEEPLPNAIATTKAVTARR